MASPDEDICRVDTRTQLQHVVEDSSNVSINTPWETCFSKCYKPNKRQICMHPFQQRYLLLI